MPTTHILRFNRQAGVGEWLVAKMDGAVVGILIKHEGDYLFNARAFNNEGYGWVPVACAKKYRLLEAKNIVCLSLDSLTTESNEKFANRNA